MYNNIGKKIKSLAFGAFIVEAIAAVITGIILMTIDDGLIGTGVLVMLGGPISAYVVSLFIYAFGELIDKACDIERNTRGEKKPEAQAKVDPERIEKLKRLRSQGLITEEEYQTALAKM